MGDFLVIAKLFFRLNSIASSVLSKLNGYQSASSLLLDMVDIMQAVHSLKYETIFDIARSDEKDASNIDEEWDGFSDDEADSFCSYVDTADEDTIVLGEWLGSLCTTRTEVCPFVQEPPALTPAAASLVNFSSICATLACTRVMVERKFSDIRLRLTRAQQHIMTLQKKIQYTKQFIHWHSLCLPVPLELEVMCARWISHFACCSCLNEKALEPNESRLPNPFDAPLLSTNNTQNFNNFWAQLEQCHRKIWNALRAATSIDSETELYQQRLHQQRTKTLDTCAHALKRISLE